MWVFLNDAFLSIVEPKEQAAGRDVLQVRARKKGHIQAVFGDVEVIVAPRADYRYRAFIPRTIVAPIIAQRLMKIDYDNFKDSIQDNDYHDACEEVWGVMNSYQHGKL